MNNLLARALNPARVLIIAIGVFISSVTFADAEAPKALRFGPEFTLVPSPEAQAQIKGNLHDYLFKYLQKKLADEQPHGQKFGTDESRHRFKSPRGWWFIVAQDPGVVEVQTKPMTLAQFEKIQADLQASLFDFAAEAGFQPQLFLGGGHINVSADYFLDNPLLFRNFFVDLLNHSELFLGIWNYDTNNALSHALLIGHKYNSVLNVIADFDKIKNPTKKDIRNFVSSMNRLMNFEDQYRKFWNKSSNSNRTNEHRWKNMAVNLMNMTEDDGNGARIEIRGFRPQMSADMWVRQIRLLENRIHYLETLNEPIPIASRIEVTRPIPGGSVSQELALNPPVNPQEALRHFYDYVTEAGELWSDHTDYIWPMWISGGELEKFEQSEWFIEQELKRLDSCDGLLRNPSAKM